MIITFIRTGILYLFLTFALRVMGRRQVGELQAGELVITILISQIASQPICDTGIPLVYSLVPIMTLISLGVIMSVISLKSHKFRALWHGSEQVLVNDGVLDQKKLQDLRFTIDDVMTLLRHKDVFDISEVQYAVAETDGTISVLLKPGKRPPMNEELQVSPPDSAFPCVLISDGRVIEKNFSVCKMDYAKLDRLLKNARLSAEDILLLTADKSGNTYIIEKERDKN